MRLSRNRNWGHPDLIALLERVAVKAQKTAGWPGLPTRILRENEYAGEIVKIP
jgi:murein endopeptidase